MITVMRAALLLCLLVACAPRAANRTATRDGSTVVITAEDIERSPGQTLEQLLLAKVPGLYVTRSRDGHTVLHLRGTTTLMGEEEPLFVVNGIPLGPNGSGNLNAINPRDIETIEVLRDAAATAIYGVRGANGVIVITTKQT
jgi:TonB-dependent starch-binding outer membrane protein SusC